MAEETEGSWEYYDEDRVLSSFWQSIKSQPNGREDPVSVWLRDFSHPKEDGDEELDVFHDYWRVKVPILLSPTFRHTCISQTWNEREIYNQLIKPLEAFICGDPDPDSIFKELGDVKPSVCGRQFAVGESCYFCKECAQDSTCVMCSTCFQNSEHRHHNYKMYTGEGGGLCDCGDTEAFNRFPSCSVHTASGAPDGKAVLPEDLRLRASFMLGKIVSFVLDKTSKSQKLDHVRVGQVYRDMWKELNQPLEFAKFCVVVVNDCFHSYPEVRRILLQALGCSQQTAEGLTEHVDKVGRAVVFVGDFPDCASIRDKVKNLSRREAIHDGRLLKCEVLPSLVVAHQNFATRLLRFVLDLFRKNSGFASLFVESVQASNALEEVLLKGVKFWKCVRGLWSSVLLNSVLKDYESKKEFAKLYIKHYSSVMKDFINDDQEAESSMTHVSLQMFTVPSIAAELIEKSDAFGVMMQAFLHQMRDQTNEPDRLLLEPWMDEPTSEYYRAKVILDDAKYLLCKAPDVWNESLRKNFLSGAKTLLQAVSMLQGADPHKRVEGDHVEFEQIEWEYVFKITINVNEVLSCVLKWCRKDKTTLCELLKAALDHLEKDFDDRLSDKMTIKTVDYDGSKYEVLRIDLLYDRISMSTPLQRFVACLITQFNAHGPTVYRHVKQRVTSKNTLCEIVDPVLSTFGLLAQIESRLWRRNGMVLNGMPSIMKVWVPFLREQDLLMLQSAVALSADPGEVMASLIQRFDLTEWVTNLGDLPPQFDQAVVDSMINEFFLLVIGVACERFTFGVGQVSEADEVRNRTIQLLSTGSMSFSEIGKQTQDEEEEFREPLKEVAVLKPSKKDPSKKVFELREEFRGQHNPYYFFYTKEQSSAAVTYQKELSKGRNVEWFPRPPTFPPLTETFSGLTAVVSCTPVLAFLVRLLEKVREGKSSLEKDEVVQQVQKALFLIVLGCEDDLRVRAEQSTTSFVKEAHERQVLEKLTGLSVPKELKPMLRHTVERLAEARRVILKISDGSPSASSSAAAESEELLAKKRRAEAVACHRAKIMAQMRKSQTQFACWNANDLEELMDESEPMSNPESLNSTSTDHGTTVVAAGVGRNPCEWHNEKHVCILCQEERPVWIGEDDSNILVMASYIHKSALLSQYPKGEGDNSVCDELYLGIKMSCGPTMSSCGHVMHSKCYQQFFDSLVAKERTNLFRDALNYNLNWQEFICPACQRLCNNVLPLNPSLNLLLPLAKPSSSDFGRWVQNTTSLLSKRRKRTVENPWDTSSSDAFMDVMKLTIDRKAISLTAVDFPKLPQNLKHMSMAFGLNTLKRCLSANPFEEDGRVLHMCLQALAHTVHQVRLAGRGSPTTTREAASLRSLTRLCALLPFAATKDSAKVMDGHLMGCLRSNAIYLLSIFLLGDQDKTFAELDAFGAVVFLVVGYPSLLYPESNRPYLVGKHDHFLIQLCLLANLVQVLVGFTPDDGDVEADSKDLEDDKPVRRLAREVSEVAGCSDLLLNRPGCSRAVKAKLLHFLRCSALFLHFVTDVPLPEEVDGDSPPEVQYQTLCAYLGVPKTIAELLEAPGASKVVNRFLASEGLARHASLRCPPRKRALVALPDNYLGVLKMGDDFRCSRAGAEGSSKHPSMCMVCGAIVCSLSSCCSKKVGGTTLGGCNVHAVSCTGGNGMFLRIRTAEVALLSEGKRGALLPAPYTDEYGESDQGLRRGNPLKLDAGMVEQLAQIWEANDIPDRISRQFDPEFRSMRANWNSL